MKSKYYRDSRNEETVLNYSTNARTKALVKMAWGRRNEADQRDNKAERKVDIGRHVLCLTSRRDFLDCHRYWRRRSQ